MITESHKKSYSAQPGQTPERYLLVKKVIVHLYLWVGFEVIWHQHDRDLNMAQFIDLEKHKINSTGYYHPDEDNWTLHHTGKETWWTWAFCPPLLPTMNSVRLQSSLLPAPTLGLGGTRDMGARPEGSLSLRDISSSLVLLAPSRHSIQNSPDPISRITSSVNKVLSEKENFKSVR